MSPGSRAATSVVLTHARGLHQALWQVPPTRVDVGLGQINLGYQSIATPSPAMCSTPASTAAQPAGFCASNTPPGEGWLLAINLPPPGRRQAAARYRRSVSQHLDRVRGRTTHHVLPKQPQRETAPMPFPSHAAGSSVPCRPCAPWLRCRYRPPDRYRVVEDHGGTSALPCL